MLSIKESIILNWKFCLSKRKCYYQTESFMSVKEGIRIKQRSLISLKQSIIITEKALFSLKESLIYLWEYYDKKQKYYDITQVSLIFSKQSNKVPNGGP